MPDVFTPQPSLDFCSSLVPSSIIDSARSLNIRYYVACETAVKLHLLVYCYSCAFLVALISACSSTRYCLELPQPDATSHPLIRS